MTNRGNKIEFIFNGDDENWDLKLDCTREELAFAIAVLQARFTEWMAEAKEKGDDKVKSPCKYCTVVGRCTHPKLIDYRYSCKSLTNKNACPDKQPLVCHTCMKGINKDASYVAGKDGLVFCNGECSKKHDFPIKVGDWALMRDGDGTPHRVSEVSKGLVRFYLHDKWLDVNLLEKVADPQPSELDQIRNDLVVYGIAFLDNKNGLKRLDPQYTRVAYKNGKGSDPMYQEVTTKPKPKVNEGLTHPSRPFFEKKMNCIGCWWECHHNGWLTEKQCSDCRRNGLLESEDLPDNYHLCPSCFQIGPYDYNCWSCSERSGCEPDLTKFPKDKKTIYVGDIMECLNDDGMSKFTVGARHKVTGIDEEFYYFEGDLCAPIEWAERFKKVKVTECLNCGWHTTAKNGITNCRKSGPECQWKPMSVVHFAYPSREKTFCNSDPEFVSISDNPDEVTCKNCLKILNHKECSEGATRGCPKNRKGRCYCKKRTPGQHNGHCGNSGACGGMG